MNDHALIEERLAARVLGGLDADDETALEQEMAAHGDCEDCRLLELAYGEVAGRLALSLDAAPVDAAMAERILAAPPATEPGGPLVLAGAETARPRRRRPAWTALVAVAAAVALIAAGVGLALARRPATATIAEAPTVTTFSPTTNGHLTLVYTPDGSGVVWGSGMTAPASGRVYALWALTGTTATLVGCPQVTDGTLVAPVSGLQDATSMAVTQEPASCPSQPTSTPIMTTTVATT